MIASRPVAPVWQFVVMWPSRERTVGCKPLSNQLINMQCRGPDVHLRRQFNRQKATAAVTVGGVHTQVLQPSCCCVFCDAALVTKFALRCSCTRQSGVPSCIPMVTRKTHFFSSCAPAMEGLRHEVHDAGMIDVVCDQVRDIEDGISTSSRQSMISCLGVLSF